MNRWFIAFMLVTIAFRGCNMSNSEEKYFTGDPWYIQYSYLYDDTTRYKGEIDFYRRNTSAFIMDFRNDGTVALLEPGDTAFSTSTWEMEKGVKPRLRIGDDAALDFRFHDVSKKTLVLSREKDGETQILTFKHLDDEMWQRLEGYNIGAY